uniref:uncharacterized protein C14orf119-like n=1 Tax=Myxine glutinosa TaxID=7769 RepID=UPI00358DF12E
MAGDAEGVMVYVSFVAMQQTRCIMHWFNGWNTAQRERFLRDLVAKACAGHPFSLLDGLSSLGVADHPPSIFECQLRLCTQWFDEWSGDEFLSFLVALEKQDPAFVLELSATAAQAFGEA